MAQPEAAVRDWSWGLVGRGFGGQNACCMIVFATTSSVMPFQLVGARCAVEYAPVFVGSKLSRKWL